MNNNKSVGVIGSGSWGTAIAQLISRNNYKVLLWGRDNSVIDDINKNHVNSKYFKGIKLSKNIKATVSLKEVAENSEVIFMVIPSVAFRIISQKLGNYLNGSHIIISATKGIEDNSFSPMSNIIEEETPVKKIGALSGPNLSKEIMMKHPSATVVASDFECVINKIKTILNHKLFNVYGSNDIIGVELSGAYKNIVAITSGISTGKNYGVNTFSYLITEGMIEMRKLGLAMGSKEETVSSLAGIGDLIATCTSPLSRNFRFGKALGEGKSLEDAKKEINQTIEGIFAVKSINHFAKIHNVKLPLLSTMHNIIYKGKEIDESIEKLLQV